MAHKALLVAFSMIAAATPALATDPAGPTSPTPVADSQGRICLRVEVTGRIVDAVECMTREEWAEQDVDVDKEWAKDGVDPRPVSA